MTTAAKARIGELRAELGGIPGPANAATNMLRGIGGTADAFGPELIRRLTCETQIDAPAPLTGLDARPVRFGGCVDQSQMLHTVDEFLK